MFNIITPTFNREQLIHRVYESLKHQTFKKFKWIVVDDASTDNTEKLIRKWIDETDDFIIEYHRLTENQGKPKAVNYGLEKCTFPYTIIADSDDTFVSSTLQDLSNVWNDISSDENNIAAIWTLVVDEDDQIKGDKFPEDKWKVSFQKRVLDLEKPLVGDKWHVWKTEILQAHPLYSAPETHVEESQTWNRINKKYDFLCLNIAFLKAHISPNSLITSKKSRRQVAKSGYYSAYYALKDVDKEDITKYNYYRTQAFNYMKSWMFYSDKALQLEFSKFIKCLKVFMYYAPKRVFNKLF